MSSQSALTENPPLVLDATCSWSKVWPKFATVRIDIRPEAHPDILMDARNLKFPNAFFDAIYCDPPHIIRKNGNVSAAARIARLRRGHSDKNFFDRFGLWSSRAEWLDFLDKTDKEFARCLKPVGLLHYKVTDGEGNSGTKVSEVLERMVSFTVINDKKTKTGKALGQNIVHWLTMKPK